MHKSALTTRRTTVASALAAAALGASRAVAQEDRYAAIDRLATQLTALGMFNGVIKIDRGGRIEFNRAYGLANYEQRISFGPRTRLRIASISKAVTNAALAALASRGRLRLDDTLDKYLPQFPSANRITLELITKHRSGIPHTNNQPWGNGSIVLSHDEVLRRLAALPLDFEPDSRRNYSNGGYAVLARVLEMVSGEPYRALMQRLVFEPAGLRDAGEILDSRAPLTRLAPGYEPGLRIGTRQPARFYAVEMRQGGGSLYASADDVLRFFQLAWRGRLEGAAAYPGLFGGTGATRIADGRDPGYYMDVHYERDADLLVSSTANNYAAETYWAQGLAQLALGRAPLFDTLPALDVHRPPDETWVGRYRFEQPYYSQDVTIGTDSGGALIFTERDAGDARAMLPLADGGYLDPLYYWSLRRDVAGRITASNFYRSDFSAALIRR